jgi:hypothetical protein
MIKDPKQHWTSERDKRRTKLENIRASLRVARRQHLMSASDSDARQVTELAELERLGDQALTFAEEQIELANQPKRPIPHSPPPELIRQRDEILQRRDYRHRVHDEQVAHELRRCGYEKPEHVAMHLRNVFGSSEHKRREADEQDKRQLQDISEQLAEWERREPRVLPAICETQNQPPAA